MVCCVVGKFLTSHKKVFQIFALRFHFVFFAHISSNLWYLCASNSFCLPFWILTLVSYSLWDFSSSVSFCLFCWFLTLIYSNLWDLCNSGPFCLCLLILIVVSSNSCSLADLDFDFVLTVHFSFCYLVTINCFYSFSNNLCISFAMVVGYFLPREDFFLEGILAHPRTILLS